MSETPKGWHRHSNGGGLVRDTAHVYQTAYVGPDAEVGSVALVMREAKVLDSAQVRDSAVVTASAVIAGKAMIRGDAVVYKDTWELAPPYIQGTKHSLYMPARGRLQIGCEDHSLKHWQKHYREIGSWNDYNEKEIEEYRFWINAIVEVARLRKILAETR